MAKSLNTEAEFNKELVDTLQKLGAYAVKIVAHPQGWMERGIPDILACYNGRMLGIEGKTLHGRYADQQIQQLRKIKLAGGFVCGAVWNVHRQQMKLDIITFSEKKELVITSNTDYYKLPIGAMKLLEISKELSA